MAADPYALPFNGYQPADFPGYYHFQPAGGGQPMLFGGDEAKRMARLIDMQPPAPDQRQATNLPTGPMPGSDPSLAGSIVGMHEAEQNDAMRRQLAPQGPAPAHATEVPAAAISTPSMPAMTSAPAAQVSAPEQPMGFGPTAEGPPAPTRQDHRVFSTEAPPVDQLQPSYRAAPGGAPAGTEFKTLPAMPGGASKAGFRPTTRTVESEGGIADPEAAKLVRAAYEDSLRATNAEERNMTQYLGTQLEQNDQRAKQAAVDAQKAQDDIERAQAVKVAAKKEYDQHIQYAQDDLDKESKRQVDQYQLFKGRPGAQLLATLGLAFGAVSSGMSGRENPAIDIVNKQIDNNIQSQKDEILRGVANKQNDIRRIREQYGVDTDEAANILSVALTQKVQAIAARQAAQSGSQNATQALVQLDGAMSQKRLGLTAGMETAILGKHKETAAEKYQAAGGGLDPLKQARRQDEFETIQLRAKLRREHPDWTEGQIKAGIKGGAGAGSPQAAGSAAAIASIDSHVAALGLAPDPSNPSRIMVADEDKTPTGKLGRASQWFGEALGTASGQKTAQAMRDIAKSAATTRSGVDHEQESKNLDLLHSANSSEQLAEYITDMKRRAVVMHAEQSKAAPGISGGGYSEGAYSPDDSEGGGEPAAEGIE